MIRWCSYCQTLLGEIAPYDTSEITHGICDQCFAKIERDEDVVEVTEPIRGLMNRIFAAASRADASTIPGLLAEAAAMKLSPASVAVGLLQPALYRAGKEWQAGGMSVAAEHRLTLWCERFFGQLPSPAPSVKSLDLLIFLAPGNPHSLGPRFAAEILAARGFSTQVVVPEIALSDMVAEIERLRPRAVGVSCALPSALPAVDTLVRELGARVAASWKRRFVVSGFALRGPDATWASAAGAKAAATLEEAERLLLAARESDFPGG